MRKTMAEYCAAQIARGERLTNYRNHHTGMRELLHQIGRPRPGGLTSSGKMPLYQLSLIREDSPGCYRASNGCWLSTDPDDYEWETASQNQMRRTPEDRVRVAKKASEAASLSGWFGSPRQVEIVRRNGHKMAHMRNHINVTIANCQWCEEESVHG
jgi:hypothetical protein